MLQSPSSSWKIDAKYLQEYKLVKKEDKKFKKNKFTDFSLINIPGGKQTSFTHQTLSTYQKKDENYKEGPRHYCEQE